MFEMISALRLPSLKIRSKLIVGFLLVLMPLFLFHGFYLRDSYEREKQIILDGKVQTSQAMASTIRAFMSDLISREGWAADLIDETDDANEIYHRLVDLREAVPAITSVAYISDVGQVVVSDPPGIPTVDLSDRPYYRDIVYEHKQWAVSDLLINRWDGSLVWVVASRVEDENGHLLGLVVATLSPTSLQRAISVDFGGNGSYAVLDRQGRAVYVSNLPDISWDERDWSWMPPVRSALSGEITTFEGLASRVDGVHRLGAFVPIQDIGWAVAVGMPEEEALGPARSHMLLEMAILLLAALSSVGVAIVSASYFIQHLRNLSQHASKLAGGDLSLRINLETRDELQELAEAFNEMAGRLQNREAENLNLIDSLKKSEARRKEFLSVVGHDLKTPLTVIKAWSDLLLIEADKGGVRGRQVEASSIIKGQVSQMLRLIDQLLDASKADTGELHLNLDRVDLTRITQKVVDSLQATSDKHSLCLRAHEQLQVECDPSRIEQVFNNLISNAIRYSPDGGDIEVVLEKKGKEVYCAIRDEGIGIPLEQQTRVFDRFYRVERKNYNEGLGLGLYICNQIILRHEGRMWLESTPGKGTSVYFVIPCGVKADQMSAEPRCEVVT